MIHRSFDKYRDFVIEECKARVKCIEGTKLLAWHSVEPHFDANNYYLFFVEHANENVVVYVFDWNKTPIAKQYNELLLINQQPTIQEYKVELKPKRQKEFKELLSRIQTKQKWEVEPIYLDGIRKELYITKNPPYMVNWNMQSNNLELNDFTAFCEENLLKNI